MTEEEANKRLKELHDAYMKHSPKERMSLYKGYQQERKKIKDELAGITPQMRELMNELYEARLKYNLLAANGNERLISLQKTKISELRKEIARLKLEESKGKTK